ncbi:uncharacterized, partial [Tachysurus ichikawai]
TVDTRHGEENVLLVKGSVVVIEMERMIHRISRDRGDRDSGIREKWGVRQNGRSQRGENEGEKERRRRNGGRDNGGAGVELEIWKLSDGGLM